jgi:hypothetical protein
VEARVKVIPRRTFLSIRVTPIYLRESSLHSRRQARFISLTQVLS